MRLSFIGSFDLSFRNAGKRALALETRDKGLALPSFYSSASRFSFASSSLLSSIPLRFITSTSCRKLLGPNLMLLYDGTSCTRTLREYDAAQRAARWLGAVSS